MQDMNLPFTIFEMAPDYAGTWYYNSYLGAGCDVFSHAYSFSFSLFPNWSRKWAKRDEILQYVQNVAKRELKLESNTKFLTKVKSARFNGKTWMLKLVKVQPPTKQKESALLATTPVEEISGSGRVYL